MMSDAVTRALFGAANIKAAQDVLHRALSAEYDAASKAEEAALERDRLRGIAREHYRALQPFGLGPVLGPGWLFAAGDVAKEAEAV